MCPSHGDDLSCPLCQDRCQDDQSHMLKCWILRHLMTSDDIAKSNVKYDNLFGSIHEQKEVTVMFNKVFVIRKQLMDEQTSSVSQKETIDYQLAYKLESHFSWT